MYAISISFGPVGTTWRLLFEKEEKAVQQYELVTLHNDKTHSFHPNDTVVLEDDYGQKVFFKHAGVHAVILENLDKSKLASVEMALHNARTQASAQQRAGADPTLRAATMTQPAVISPMGNGRWPS